MQVSSEVSPMSVGADGSSLPVTIVGGYLGSGKTTLINQILNKASGRRYAVLVNDFGELAIDAQLIESEDGNVINLSGGCVCCSYGNDLTSAMMELDTSAIDQVVIEASGVALPGAIAGSLSLLTSYTLSSIVVLADCVTVQSHASDKYLADTIARQLASADLILLNKTDLLDESQLVQKKDWVRSNYQSARCVATSHADYPVDLFLTEHTSRDVNQCDKTNDSETHLTSVYTTFKLEVKDKYNVQQLAANLAETEPGLLRVKGFARDLSGQMQLIQIVGRRWNVRPAPVSAKEGIVCIGLSADNLCSEGVSARAGLI